MSERYVRPDWITQHVLNPIVSQLTRLGISVYGSRVLAVRGRTSGEWRATPVNVLTHEGGRYLVSPRGVTQWVRNLRATGDAQLRLGSRQEPIRVAEVPDTEKPRILRAYLKRWQFEVAEFFEGVGPAATDAELQSIASGHPVFRILN